MSDYLKYSDRNHFVTLGINRLFLTSFIVLTILVFGGVLTPIIQMVAAQANSVQQNEQLIKSFVEVFNKHDVTAVDQYYSVDLIQHNPIAAQGREGFKQFFKPFFSAFPDSHTTIEHIVGQDNLVLVFLNWAGTQKGEFQGFVPTNKPVNMRTADLFRIDTNSTIVEHWDLVDSLNLLTEIGAITFNQPPK